VIRLGIVDYQAGNLASVRHAAIEAARLDALGVDIAFVSTPEALGAYDQVILPGVGTFGGCAQQLRAQSMFEAVDAHYRSGKPLLGICVGMQLMARTGHERGTNSGFGWFDAEVTRLDNKGAPPRLPHMGWNTPHWTDAASLHPVTRDLPHGEAMYFVHSFAFDQLEAHHSLAEVDYGGKFVAAVARDNIIGVQFHPEKSQRAGLAFLRAFLRWRP
jgi:imidazole glycerol-phosphate synthase subunit HisH